MQFPPISFYFIPQIFSSAPCSRAPSFYVLSLMSETKFHTSTKLHAVLCTLIFFFRQQSEDKWFWN
jgi:hypothetical protein